MDRFTDSDTDTVFTVTFVIFHCENLHSILKCSTSDSYSMLQFITCLLFITNAICLVAL